MHNLKDRLLDTSILGMDTAFDDGCLQRAVEGFAAVADDPASRRVLLSARTLLSANEATRPGRALDLLNVIHAAEIEYAGADVVGDLVPFAPAEHAYTRAAFSQLQPLLAALDGFGNGRIPVLADAWANHPEYFADARVLPHLVSALGEARDQLEELFGRILLSLGKRAVPYLKDGFRPDGMLEMARRAYWVARLAGAEENDWYLSVLPVSQRDVREMIIAALGASQDNAPLLLALYHSELDKKCRDTALRALARMEDEESRAFWTEELERRSDCPPCLEGVDAPLASDMAAQALRDAFSEALERGNDALSRAELLTLSHAVYAAYGKHSGKMRETWLWCAENLPALEALKPDHNASQCDLTAAELLEKCLLETVLWNPCEGVRALARELGERCPARFLSAAVLSDLLVHPAETFDHYGKLIVRNGLLRRENAADREKRIQIMHALAAVRNTVEDGRHIPFARKDMLTGASTAMLYRLPDFDPRWAETFGDPRVNCDGAVYDLKNPWSLAKQMFQMEWIE